MGEAVLRIKLGHAVSLLRYKRLSVYRGSISDTKKLPFKPAFKLVTGALIFMKSEPTTFG